MDASPQRRRHAQMTGHREAAIGALMGFAID
jgi:hypothetical protein